MGSENDLLDDLKMRISLLQEEIRRIGADACIVCTNVNLFYLSGCIYNGYLYVPAFGDIIHFVKRPESIALESTIYIRKPEQMGEVLEQRGLAKPKKVLLELDVISFNECQRLSASIGIGEVLNASVLLRAIRSVKTDFELSQIRLCAQKHSAVYENIRSLFVRGMTDLELQIEIERLMRLSGSQGIFRSYGQNMDIHMGSLLVGENAGVGSPYDFALGGQGVNASLPLGACGVKIEEGQTIMVDMAGNYTPWMTDMTRIFSVGRVTELAYRAHQVSLEIQDAIMYMSKPGVACADLYNKAVSLVEKNGLASYFMGTKQQAKFVGHGLGLEINEPPVLTSRSREVLQTNIVFALEPKFVIPKVGAVGIENTFVVTPTGLDKITIFEEDIIEL